MASDYDTDTGNSGSAGGCWKDVTASFTTGAVVSGNIEIRLRAGQRGASDSTPNAVQTSYDNVRLDAVSEPSSAALIGIAGFSLILRRCT